MLVRKIAKKRSPNRRTDRLVKAFVTGEFRRNLMLWAAKHGRMFPWRKANATLYHQVVSEVLLQRTRAEAVATFWPIFVKRFPNWKAIANSAPSTIEAILKPLGLSKQRAPRLKGLAIAITSNNARFPKTREDVEALPGVGQYIANAIELFVHKKPRPLIDVNMARVLERYFGPRSLADIRFDTYLQHLAQRVVQCNQPLLVNWGILDLAASICTREKPACPACPLRRGCRYGRQVTRAATRPAAAP